MSTTTGPRDRPPLLATEAPPACCAPVSTAPDDARQRWSDHARAFKALADPARLQILERLARSAEPRCECEIVPELDLSQPTVSYHLKLLRQAGLISSERRGQWVFHQVRAEALLHLVGVLADLRRHP